MQLISDEYKKVLETTHENNPSWGSTGNAWAQNIITLTEGLKSQDVLDYGCGKGHLARQLPFKINQYDPCIPKHSELPKPAKLVVCLDVMEHIEPENIDNVLDHIKSLTISLAFFVISTVPAKQVLSDGRNAHLVVEGAEWWLSKLWPRFEVYNFNNTPNALIVSAGNKEVAMNARLKALQSKS